MSTKNTPRRTKTKLDAGLLAAHKAYEAAINSNKTDLVMAMYDKDAEILQPDGKLVSGWSNIRKWVDDYFNAYKTHWTKIVKQNWVSGEFGFDQGHDTAVDTPRQGGKSIRWDCKGILIYKRQKNGEWRVFRDVWNNNKPPTSS